MIVHKRFVYGILYEALILLMKWEIVEVENVDGCCLILYYLGVAVLGLTLPMKTLSKQLSFQMLLKLY